MCHIDHYFEQDECIVLHQIDQSSDSHIDILKYKPTDKYPFWKLVAMGASNFRMPKVEKTLGDRNEYIMFICSNIDLDNEEILRWYYNKLLTVANYSIENNVHLTYGHSIEFEKEEDSDIVCAYIDMPVAVDDPHILRCKLSFFKKTTCLEVVLLTKYDMDVLFEIGSKRFSMEYLSPEDRKPHYLSEKNRTIEF